MISCWFSPEYLHLSKADTFPRVRLTQAASLAGVADTSGLDVGFQLWRNVETGQRRGIMLMAFDPHDRVFALSELVDEQRLLDKPDVVLIDRLSRREFGPKEAGVTTEVGRHKVHVGGEFTLGTGFGADGALVASEETFRRLLPYRTPREVNLGLVRLTPGHAPAEVASALRDLLPREVQVLTRAEISARERRHWMTKTSVGIIFGFGVLVALFVGTAIVYQVLASDIASRLPNMPRSRRWVIRGSNLSRLVLEQALILAIAGFVPGLALAELLYQITERLTHIPISMTLSRARGSADLVVGHVLCFGPGVVGKSAICRPCGFVLDGR